MSERYLLLQKTAVSARTGMSVNSSVEFFQKEGSKVFSIRSGKTQMKIGVTKQRDKEYPEDAWDTMVSFYENSGYVPIGDKKVETLSVQSGGQKFAPISDKTFLPVLNRMVSANDAMIEELFSKSVLDVPDERIQLVQQTLIEMVKAGDKMPVKEFNNKLLKVVWTQIPRAQNQLCEKLAKSPKDYPAIIQREQEILDNLVQLLNKARKSGKVEITDTILSANNLFERPVTAEEKKLLKDLMTDKSSMYVRAWRTGSKEQDERFEQCCKEHGYTEENGGVQYLFHGTGFSNIWSIWTNGLYLNPEVLKSNVRICGKAFGYGLYFAPYIYKSMGYCSNDFGSGRHAHGYMLVFKVMTGNPYYIYRDKNPKRPNHWKDFHRDHPDMDCCWAESGSSNGGFMRLRWDEVIVYREEQAALQYIIEYDAA